ncbi:hypothetical protein AYO28_24020 [Pseudomonas putida]|uniref:Uncharacterized protein n=1 Tax=Pseudomonas putida TaxID=303 RepID=A0A177SGF3_PSEPU|nr:hypothetical protein AYO28_24020 [Pseudomonas putida]
MPVRIDPVDRITQAIPIGIQATALERALAVRRVEAHEHRVIGAVAETQQVMAGAGLDALAIEPEACGGRYRARQ